MQIHDTVYKLKSRGKEKGGTGKKERKKRQTPIYPLGFRNHQMRALLVEIQLTVPTIKCNKGPQGAEILLQLHMKERQGERKNNLLKLEQEEEGQMCF